MIDDRLNFHFLIHFFHVSIFYYNFYWFEESYLKALIFNFNNVLKIQKFKKEKYLTKSKIVTEKGRKK